MIFKAIRYLIYSSLILIVEDKRIYDVDVDNPVYDIYDNYEVIGIRAESYDHENYVVVSLRPTITAYYESGQYNPTLEHSQSSTINAKE